MRKFVFPHATVEFYNWGACTVFPDGESVPATPQDNDEYRIRAVQLGYGSDTLAMCLDHELLHSVAAELLLDGPSPVLWAVAHGQPSKRRGFGAEEDLILRLQTELRRVPPVWRV